MARIMYDTVLVPTDGSDHAVRAAEHAGYLAGAFDATIHVVAVVDVQAAAGPFDAGGVDEAFVDRLEEEADRAMTATTGAVSEGDKVRTETVRGDPETAIVEYVTDRGIDLVAMGTHGRRGIDRYVAGSVTESVLRRAPVPVLTVRAVAGTRIDDGYDEVLVPTDGSDLALAAVDHAVAVAAATDARVHALTAVSDGDEATGPQATDAVVERVRTAGLDAVAAVKKGTPAEAVLAYAGDADVDLVVMGTAGRGGLGRQVLGSTTERVLRRAETPVLGVTVGAGVD
jgi:nucleotide-binding universal stress UspA family protein